MSWLTAIAMAVPLLLGAAGGAWLAARGPRRPAAPDDDPPRLPPEAERLAELSRLTGGLMHEIRNPLSTLNLNLQLLAEDLESAETQNERRMARKVAVIRDETRRLEEILNKFTAVAGRMELKKKRLGAAELVGDLVAFYEPQAQQRRITVRSAVEADLPPIEGDADLLKQALLNLILNAEVAMKQGGELMISVRPDGGGVAITVTDTGCGIPSEQLAKVFEAYYSTRPGGTGLGLPIVRRIVSEHGGTVAVASEVGRGTQFVIWLPAAPRQSGDAGG